MGALLLPLLAAGMLTIPEADARFILGIGEGDRSGGLVVQVLVAPDHVVDSCRVLLGASAAVASRICDEARKLRVPIVATDTNGEPIHGFVNVARIPVGTYDRFPLIYPVDIEVGVLDLPGRSKRKTVTVTVLSEAAGTVTQCQEDSPEDGELGTIACNQASQLQLPIVRDRSGEPVRYVRTITVDFVERPSSD